mmetsp:Transcript_152011/g.488031  ORF Transcript_152011/g.488031 Transcript_152011/m.488031 type:complete len:720 (+) Transcript_152011:97-2256(+)
MAARLRCISACSLSLASLLGLSALSLPVARALPLRTSLLDAAHDRVNNFYKDSQNLDDPKQQAGVVFRLSKDDKECGGDGVPLSFIEYDVDGARPIDVFNVLSDAHNQPSWDEHCAKMDPLGDFTQVQAKGFAGLFVAPGAPVSGREGYEWMVAEANFTTEEFWLVMSTYNNNDLKQKRPFDSGSVEMQNCMAAYKITKTDKGSHVVNTQQINSHSWPLSARYVANTGWTGSIDFATSLRKVAPTQKQKGWNQTQTFLPSWMLVDRPCGVEPVDEDLRLSILGHAATEMALPEKDRGSMSTATLASGEKMKLWRREKACGGGGVPSTDIPAWWAEFTVPKAKPEEVFNWLVAKADEKSWHKGQGRVNLTGFHSGARGVHEEFLAPWPFESRELWEWQVANQSLATRTYLLALESAPEPTTPKFGDGKAAVASQCLAAYEVSPTAGGTLLRMSSHLNPNVGLLSKLSILWVKAGEQMIKDFANALSTAAAAGAPPTIDGGALALLAPPPPGRNASLTVAGVAGLPGNGTSLDFLRGVAGLDLPQVLDVSAVDLPARAQEVFRLYHRLEKNATKEDASAFEGGRAMTAAQLQLQGEALAALQLRALGAVAVVDCEGGVPDFDHDKSGGGIPIMLMAGIAVGVLAVIAMCCTWCCCRCAKRRRAKRAAVDASALLAGHRDAAAAAEAGAVAEAGALEWGDGASCGDAGSRGATDSTITPLSA